jgi:L-aspartate oxidase
VTPPAARAPGSGGPGPLDVLVLGSGVAGLSAAVRLAAPEAGHGLTVGVLTKGELSQSATRWAQGGVAAVLGGDEDSTDLHLADTLAAGAGLCDVDAVRVMVDEGPGRVEELIAMGARFDREASGTLALAREGGHSRPRVVHAGGAATGAEVERALVEETRSAAGAVMERWFALDLVVERGRCVGVLALPPGGSPVVVRARHVVMATGGTGQLFAVTTNPSEATGDGLAMALRSGVAVSDVEFVQFHPTALHHPAMPRPLLSEALRGHGAILRDASGKRFTDELAPRDVVSRAMAARMAEQGVDHLWLDATGLEGFGHRFPTIADSLAAIGLDPSVEWLPIAPAAHHLSGGVITDLWGATGLPGLWAVGEVACTGVHGANRLASNSLLEGMVFGARLAEAIARGAEGPTATGVMRALLEPTPVSGTGAAGARRAANGVVAREGETGRIPVRPLLPAHTADRGHPPGDGPATVDGAGSGPDAAEADLDKLRDQLQRVMTAGAGVVRSAASLDGACADLADLEALLGEGPPSPGRTTVARGEVVNLLTVGRALLASARAREETRGAHARDDFPRTDPAWRCRLMHGSLTGRGTCTPGAGAAVVRHGGG